MLTRSVPRRWASAVLLVFVLIFAPRSAAPRLLAQTSSTAAITGQATDTNGHALVGAAVVIRLEKSSEVHNLTTDANGRFSAADLTPGTYIVEVSAEGLVSGRQTVTVKSGDSKPLTIALEVTGVSESVDVSDAAEVAIAPSVPVLAARSAESVVTEDFIQNDTTPQADFSQVLQAVPGMFSYTSNGPGLGDTKTFFRGFKDGQYNIGFDGIPFYDSNDPTHHSWAFFPTQFLGGTVVDRSPGSAASIGPTTFGGSVNLLSRNLSTDSHVLGDVSYGSFNTRLFNGEYETGAHGNNRLLVNAQGMFSDGYQTFNHQERNGVSGKYQFTPSSRTTLTLFSSYVRVVANTPDWKDPLRSWITQFGDNYLMSSDPTAANYYGYEHYHVTTDFSYFGVKTDLGGGWSIDDKVYLYAYHNHEHFNAETGPITATSGTNKLNAYRTVGNILPLTQTSSFGTLRTGLWSQLSLTNRYQVPEDPTTLIDAALPKFHETFNTISLQPYLEYELHPIDRLKITPGVKRSTYIQDFVQFADNGKTVGNLNGAPSISHSATYSSWLPSLDVHYLVQSNQSVYVQYAKGDAIPPTSVFDTSGAVVGVLPKPTVATTFQTGTVWQGGRAMFGFDVFHTRFDNAYSSTLDPSTNMPDFFATAPTISKGVEFESNVIVAGGLSVYLNATGLSARYTDTGQHVANSPKHTEALGVNLVQSGFTVSVFAKHAASLFNDNSAVHEAIPIDPVTMTNLSISYDVRNPAGFSKQMKIRFNMNNIFNNHNIVAVTPASKSTSVPSPNDLVTLLAARSAALTFTFDLARP